jgi:hypothetical protein
MICKQFSKICTKNITEIFIFHSQRRTEEQNMEARRRTSSVSSNSAAKVPEIKKPVISGNCTYVRLIYSGNYLFVI